MQHEVILILIVCLILFSIFRRVRRNIGWQLLKPGNTKVRTVIFLIIGALFLVSAGLHPISLVSDAVGIVLGVVLAYYAAVMTRFEQRDGRWHFRPNTWIGSAVIALFFVRLAYRFYEVYSAASAGGLHQDTAPAGGFQNMASSASSPWASGLLLILFAYYATYNVLLLRKQKGFSEERSS